jgi:hypothetical protein
VTTAPGPVRKRQQQQAYDPVKITVTTKLGTVRNTSAAADLFATMLRSVEMAEKRIAEGKRNGRTGTAASQNERE